MLIPRRTVAPAVTPISLADAKANLRVDQTDEDSLITALIEAATANLDGFFGILGRCMVTQTWQQDFDELAEVLRLPLPAASIASISYFDASNVSQTLNAAWSRLYEDAGGSYVLTDPAQSWPATYDRPDALTVTFTAGYGAAAAVPGALRQALQLLVAHYNLNREATTALSLEELPLGVRALVVPYRVARV